MNGFLSDYLSTTLIFFVTTLLAKYVYVLITQKLPPGPLGLPFVGYLPWMKVALPTTIHKLAQKYGPIFSVNTGRNYTIFLSSPELIKEAFWKDELTGRPENAVLKIFDGFGITNTGGSLWKSERRFLHVQLRKLGMTPVPKGPQEIENIINVELKQFLETLNSFKGSPCNVDGDMRHMTTNILSNILMSARFEKKHPFYKKIEELHESGFVLYAEADHYTKFPGLTKLPGFEKALLKLKSNRNQEIDLIKNFIRNKRQRFDPLGKPDNIIDAYLLEEYENHDKNTSAIVQNTHDEQLCQVLIDLYSGGSETVTTALNWTFLFLLLNPDVTRKVQEEIEEIIGCNRLPTLDDRSSLPYTQATIYEVLRLGNAVPLAAPHAALEDTFIAGYCIPRGSTVISNIYSCHIDPKLWPNPQKFDPTRFLDGNGKVFKPEAFMPFGVGKRMCIGDVLVRCELFLIVATVLQAYDIRPADEKSLPSEEGVFGTTTKPQEFELRFLKRSSTMSNADETIKHYDSRCF